MKSYELWFAEMWRFVEPALPPAPASVLEIGCGRFGGFVPRLAAAGYDAVGVDPEAPDGPGYERMEFEQYPVPKPVDAIVACTSLHHVADLDAALDRVAAMLIPGGAVVIVEWAWESFDEQTAQWCFDRLARGQTETSEEDRGWLHNHWDRFEASGLSWDAYHAGWASEEGLHRGERIVAGLDARFIRGSCETGPYFFADLDGVTFADERAAIDVGLIRPTGIRYLATTPLR
ncbi:MAG TPA: class I SAM-dependent methyltransferase [Streptosporangiaceae bacterium]